MRSEEEIREMIDRLDRKIEEDPVFDGILAPKEDSPLHQAKLALKWVLGEMELREEVKEAEDEERKY